MTNCSGFGPAELQETCREPAPKNGVAGRDVYVRKQGEPPQSGHYVISWAMH